MIDMDARLADMPVMARRRNAIDAKMYNLWQHAKRWLGPLTILDLPGLKTMRFVFSTDYWVVADSANFYVPVIAWVDFDDAGRNSLHEPIGCQINYYHFAASALRLRSLELAYSQLSNELERHRRTPPGASPVTPIF